MTEEKKKTLSVDVSRLQQFWGIDLNAFEPGKTYPLSKLMDAIGLQRGTPGPKTRGDAK